MGFTVEQDCPQCGGPIDLDETDCLLPCPYCGVKNFLFTPDYFRFVLPHKAPAKEIIYAPYLRFKGNVYFCRDMSIGHRVVDITHVGLQFKGLPSSLGLRPQAMKLKFVNPAAQGSFLKFSLKASDIVAKAAKLSSDGASGNILHHAYIGETLSLIYLPLFVESEKIFDAVLNRPIAALPQGHSLFESDTISPSKWGLSFIPTICPQCGWDLEGEKDSVVLMCGNCDTAWEASKGGFKNVELWAVPGHDEKTLYLPFWRISATVKGAELHSFADFIRLTNQPMVIHKEWENQDMYFWSPAFKIRPKIFLQVSRQITVMQTCFKPEKKAPQKNLYPVTLPRDEASQATKLTLAGSAVTKKNVFSHLPAISFVTKDCALIFLPFSDTGHEMVLEDTRISINKQTLEYGRDL